MYVHVVTFSPITYAIPESTLAYAVCTLVFGLSVLVTNRFRFSS